eukprot:snap_masked-scaffold_3-processed-gene-8.12-mRNA-1 protein AED:1.00 eAED:1.00 QI:0/0/0/0/1/1/2/0/258
MCFTLELKTTPEDELCGRYGTCIHAECICDKGFTKSLLLLPVTDENSDVNQLFENMTLQEENSLKFEVFYKELVSRAPCNTSIPFYKTFFNIIIFVNFVCLLYSILSKSNKKTRIVCILSITTNLANIFSTIIYNYSRQLPNHPYSVLASFAAVLVYNSLQLTFFAYFHKHTTYHLNKMKIMNALRTSYCGYDISGIFKFQNNFLFLFGVLLYGGLNFCVPVQVAILRRKSSFSYDELVEINNILAILFLMEYFFQLF